MQLEASRSSARHAATVEPRPASPVAQCEPSTPCAAVQQESARP
jgi:hypothetical protein